MDRFNFIPGLSEVPNTDPAVFKTQGETIRFRFKAMPSSQSRWDSVLKTSGSGGDLLWEEVDGSAIQPVNVDSGIYEITLPKSLTDFLRRGAYVIGILQKYWLGSKNGEYRVTISFNVTYDASSPNPVYTYTLPSVFPPFDPPEAQDEDNI
jgi:hypothetical protein